MKNKDVDEDVLKNLEPEWVSIMKEMVFSNISKEEFRKFLDQHPKNKTRSK